MVRSESKISLNSFNAKNGTYTDSSFLESSEEVVLCFLSFSFRLYCPPVLEYPALEYPVLDLEYPVLEYPVWCPVIGYSVESLVLVEYLYPLSSKKS